MASSAVIFSLLLLPPLWEASALEVLPNPSTYPPLQPEETEEEEEEKEEKEEEEERGIGSPTPAVCG